MLNKRIVVIIFLIFGILLLNAYAWPWDSPEVKARKLVDKLEEYASKIDRLEEIEGLGWNPFFQRLSKETKG